MNSFYTAVIKQDANWWIGWIEEVPGVNCQESTREKLLMSLRETLAEAIELNRADALEAVGSGFEELSIAVRSDVIYWHFLQCMVAYCSVRAAITRGGAIWTRTGEVLFQVTMKSVTIWLLKSAAILVYQSLKNSNFCSPEHNLSLTMNNQILLERSRQAVWHPCTQMKRHESLPLVPISHGKGVWLYDFDGKRYLDAFSSWWGTATRASMRHSTRHKSKISSVSYEFPADFSSRQPPGG